MLLSIAGTLMVGAGGAFALDRLALAMVRPPIREPGRTPMDLGLPFDEVTFRSGRQQLAGWLLRPGEDTGRSAVVLAHGWASQASRMLAVAEPLVHAGHPVLAFDVRGHGRSGAAPYVTARHFRDDVIEAARFLAEWFPDRPRLLLGYSMGGATSVLAASEGAPADGLALVGTPADLFEIWSGYMSDKGLPGPLVVRACWPFWRYRAGVPFHTLVPVNRIQDLGLPVLIVHGDQDRRVPVDHASRLARAAGVEPTLVQGAGHSDLLQDRRLHEAVLGFLDELEGSRTDS